MVESLYISWPRGRAEFLNLLYLSTSFLWWQTVASIIGGKSSNALRMHSRCPWRHREGARNVYNTAIRRAPSPLRPCGSATADGHGCPPRRCTDQAPSRAQGHPGGAHGRRNNAIASPCHVRRCPPISPLFAFWESLLHTQCSLEALDRTVHERNHNFCLPHASLRQPLPQPLPTNGTGSAKHWCPCTPAMAAGLTNHAWTLREVLLYRVPPWPQPAGV
jgi:hypothetical protein